VDGFPMRIRIIWTGKTRDARLRALIEDYAERLSHFVRCEVTELRELGRTDKAGIDKETKRRSGIKEVAFVIGGPNGLADDFKSRADKRWSLSRLTLTHEMARVLLLEQLYRAYTIVHGLPYQK
jgi:23S rRNA (pseudouridine1915-N3)-methyltransferase